MALAARTDDDPERVFPLWLLIARSREHDALRHLPAREVHDRNRIVLEVGCVERPSIAADTEACDDRSGCEPEFVHRWTGLGVIELSAGIQRYERRVQLK